MAVLFDLLCVLMAFFVSKVCFIISLRVIYVEVIILLQFHLLAEKRKETANPKMVKKRSRCGKRNHEINSIDVAKNSLTIFIMSVLALLIDMAIIKFYHQDENLKLTWLNGVSNIILTFVFVILMKCHPFLQLPVMSFLLTLISLSITEVRVQMFFRESFYFMFIVLLFKFVIFRASVALWAQCKGVLLQ